MASSPDVILDMPAARAKLGPGMTVVAVDGKAFSPDVLRDAASAARSSKLPIQLLVSNEGALIIYPIDYHGGEQYPHLVRDGTKPDALSQITTDPETVWIEDQRFTMPGCGAPQLANRTATVPGFRPRPAQTSAVTGG
jgi:hypothetical protein